MRRRRWHPLRVAALACHAALALVLAPLDPTPAAAQSLISRTITVDGDMGDWHAEPAIPANAGQATTDCEATQACELDVLQSTGRDLKRFAYTWDENNLYFFVERYASSSNSNTWLFYLDENTNGFMDTGERIFQVDWWGSNRQTTAHVCVYTATDAAGDSIRGDGHTMPGTASGCSGNLYTDGVYGGSSNGLEMESRLAWSALGFTGPQNIRFHISSARGVNLPSHVEDNMGAPSGDGGGELFPPDMALTIGSSAAELPAFGEATITVTLRNVYYDPFSDITVGIPLPAPLLHVSHAAPGGTSFTDSDGDGEPDVWTVPQLSAEEVLVLEVTVRAAALPSGASALTTATLLGWTGTDTEGANNADTVEIEVSPAPQLAAGKSASADGAVPGTVVTYTVDVANMAEAPAHGVRVQTELDPHVALRLDGFGPGEPFEFVDGASASGLSIGSVEYSADGGVTWDYLPASGGGGAPAGHDGNVTHWRIEMSGAMDPDPASFQIRYMAVVR